MVVRMNKNPITKGMIEENSVGIGEVSEEMVEERAKELALIAGHRMTKEYHEQALRELSGGSEIDEKTSFLESVSEEDRWEPVPRARGQEVEESGSEEEDEDGRGEDVQLVEEGVSEAEHDQMVQAARADRNQE